MNQVAINFFYCKLNCNLSSFSLSFPPFIFPSFLPFPFHFLPLFLSLLLPSYVLSFHSPSLPTFSFVHSFFPSLSPSHVFSLFCLPSHLPAFITSLLLPFFLSFLPSVSPSMQQNPNMSSLIYTMHDSTSDTDQINTQLQAQGGSAWHFHSFNYSHF